MAKNGNGSSTATQEPPVAPSTVRPARNQKRLIDDGGAVPPAGTIAVHDYAMRLVRRTASHMKALPINFQRWVVDMLDAEIDQAEADDLAIDDTLNAIDPIEATSAGSSSEEPL